MAGPPPYGSGAPVSSLGAPDDGDAAAKDAELEEPSMTPSDAYPTAVKLALLLLAVFANMFLVALESLAPQHIFCYSTVHTLPIH